MGKHRGGQLIARAQRRLETQPGASVSLSEEVTSQVVLKDLTAVCEWGGSRMSTGPERLTSGHVRGRLGVP